MSTYTDYVSICGMRLHRRINQDGYIVYDTDGIDELFPCYMPDYLLFIVKIRETVCKTPEDIIERLKRDEEYNSKVIKETLFIKDDSARRELILDSDELKLNIGELQKIDACELQKLGSEELHALDTEDFMTAKEFKLEMKPITEIEIKKDPITNSFKCTDCEKSYKAKSELKSHLWYKHNKGGVWRQCTECKKKFKKDTDLKRHLWFIHNKGGKWYRCSECSLSFKHSTNMKRHAWRMHDKYGKWFQCTDCVKKFRMNRDLKKHMWHLHDKGGIWYDCTECEMKFKSSTGLKMHLWRAHDKCGIWRPCTDCEMKFKTTHELKRHLARIHSKYMYVENTLSTQI